MMNVMRRDGNVNDGRRSENRMGRREEEGKGKRHSMLYCLRNKSRDNGI